MYLRDLISPRDSGMVITVSEILLMDLKSVRRWKMRYFKRKEKKVEMRGEREENGKVREERRERNF